MIRSGYQLLTFSANRFALGYFAELTCRQGRSKRPKHKYNTRIIPKEGTAKRKYYDTKMNGDSSALFSSAQDMIEYMLSEPKVLMWTVRMLAARAGAERLEPLNIIDSSPAPHASAYPKGSGTLFSPAMRFNYGHFLSCLNILL